MQTSIHCIKNIIIFIIMNLFIFIYRLSKFWLNFVPKILTIFVLYFSLSIHSMLLIPFYLIIVGNTFIHEFRGLPFILLVDGYHSKFFRGSLSPFIFRTWAYHQRFVPYIIEYRIININLFSYSIIYTFFKFWASGRSQNIYFKLYMFCF